MNPIYLVTTFLMLSFIGISQSQTDKYLITRANIGNEDLSYPYITTKAYFEYSIDDQDVRYLKIVKDDEVGYSFGMLDFIKESQIEIGGRMLNVQECTWHFTNSYDDVSGTAHLKISSETGVLFLDMTLENSDTIRIAGRYINPSNPPCEQIATVIQANNVVVEEVLTPSSELNSKITFYRSDTTNTTSYYVICYNRFNSIEVYTATIPDAEFNFIIEQLPSDETMEIYIDKLRPYFNDLYCSW